WKLRFVGSDMGLSKNKSYKLSLEERARDLGIFEKTEWLGFTEEVEQEYKAADIMLNFSESESFSITCLESLFYGRPVIATDCGGPAEIIDHQETGLLVPNRSVAEMANSMLLLALDTKSRIHMGLRARKIVREKFSVSNLAIVKNIYEMAMVR